LKTKKGLTVLFTTLFVLFISVGLYGCTQQKSLKTSSAKKVTVKTTTPAATHKTAPMISNGMNTTGKMAAPMNKSTNKVAEPITHKVVKKISSKNLEVAAMKIINAQSCLGCHVINGKGGSIGPNLSKEGNKGRSINWLEVQINTPKVHSPNTMMPNHNLNSTQLKTLAEYLNSLK